LKEKERGVTGGKNSGRLVKGRGRRGPEGERKDGELIAVGGGKKKGLVLSLGQLGRENIGGRKKSSGKEKICKKRILGTLDDRLRESRMKEGKEGLRGQKLFDEVLKGGGREGDRGAKNPVRRIDGNGGGTLGVRNREKEL